MAIFSPLLTVFTKPIDYSITYNGMDGAAVNPANPVTYHIESGAITLNNPTKPGYIFTGWTGADLTDATMEVTIPAGESITVAAGQPKDASMDYVGKDKGKDGFDMATRLGSNLTFTEQTASICRFEEIEMIAQNFGFDLENGITEVTLDLNQDHYWMQVRKIRTD